MKIEVFLYLMMKLHQYHILYIHFCFRKVHLLMQNELYHSILNSSKVTYHPLNKMFYLWIHHEI